MGDVVIIGGGLAGLLTNFYLSQKGIQPTLIEPGGIGGIANFGVHWVNYNKSSLSALGSIGVDPGEPVPVKAGIFWDNRLITYPSQLSLRSLPVFSRIRALLSLFAGRLGKVKESYYDYCRWLMGHYLADNFVVPHSIKSYGIHPRQIDISEVSRTPVAPLLNIILSIFKDQTHLSFKSFECGKLNMNNLIAILGKDLKLIQSRVNSVDLNRRTVSMENGETIEWEELVATVSLKQLARLAKDVPPLIRSASELLRSRPLMIVRLKVSNLPDKFKGYRVVYSPGEEKFHRINIEEGYVNVEVSLSEFEYNVVSEFSHFKFGMISGIIDQLENWGFLIETEFAETSLLRDGLVIPDNYYQNSFSVKNFFSYHDVFLCGRLAEWSHKNFEHLAVRAKRVAGEILRRRNG